MAISRAKLAKELEPGLNALFGMEYDRYENQHAEIFTTESSDRSFEEEVMLSGFGAAPTKSEGSSINFDDALIVTIDAGGWDFIEECEGKQSYKDYEVMATGFTISIGSGNTIERLHIKDIYDFNIGGGWNN